VITGGAAARAGAIVARAAAYLKVSPRAPRGAAAGAPAIGDFGRATFPDQAQKLEHPTRPRSSLAIVGFSSRPPIVLQAVQRAFRGTHAGQLSCNFFT
jgi:hypothetical protein